MKRFFCDTLFLLPVLRGGEEWSAQRAKSQLLGFSNDCLAFRTANVRRADEGRREHSKARFKPLPLRSAREN
ncbi:MAG: hypothetical protein E5X48_16870 [Mesorhizobium sp.]|nr:MAG: hypothetical protein E5X48_16870 [Mesorhizobium sp.]